MTLTSSSDAPLSLSISLSSRSLPVPSTFSMQARKSCGGGSRDAVLNMPYYIQGTGGEENGEDGNR